jgi:hypothetical protein
MTRPTKVLAALGCLALILGVGTPRVLGQETEPASEIKDITFEKVDDQLRVFVRIDGPFTFETLEVQAPQRLVLDFKGVTKISAAPVIEVNELGVASIRTGQFQPDVGRVVFDLAETAPSHSLTQVEDGLRVVFWMEAAQPEAAPEKAEEPAQKPEVKEAPPLEKPVPPPPPAPRAPRDFFARLGGGLAIAGMPDTSATRDLYVYAEHGSLDETYRLKTGWIADLALGKYLTPSIRVGLGATLKGIGTHALISATIPHPFQVGQPTTVSFPEMDLNHTLMNFYAFGLFSLVRMDKFELSAGPTLGFAKADYEILEDFTFTDTLTSTGRTITIDSTTYAVEASSGLSLGAWLMGQYWLGPNLSLVLDARLFYFDVKVANLGKRANLSSIDLLLGFQYNF